MKMWTERSNVAADSPLYYYCCCCCRWWRRACDDRWKSMEFIATRTNSLQLSSPRILDGRPMTCSWMPISSVRPVNCRLFARSLDDAENTINSWTTVAASCTWPSYKIELPRGRISYIMNVQMSYSRAIVAVYVVDITHGMLSRDHSSMMAALSMAKQHSMLLLLI